MEAETALSDEVEMSVIDPVHGIPHQFGGIVEVEFLFDVRTV